MTKIPSMELAAQSPRTPWRWFSLTLGLVFLRALPNLRFPIGRDQATCCVIAQRMLNGLHLYRELLDNRPPGIFWLYAPFVKLFGAVMWVAALADIFVVLAVAGMLFLFAWRRFGIPIAVMGTVIAAAFHCSAGYVSAAQPDGLLLVFVFAACAILSMGPPVGRVRTISAGAILAGAFWVKYNSIAFFPWLVLIGFLDWSALDGREPRLRFKVGVRELSFRLAELAAGFAVVSLLVLGVFVLNGSWARFRESQFDVLLRYSATALGQQSHAAWAVSELYRYVGPWNHAAVALALLLAWRRREVGLVLPIFLGFFSAMAAIILPGKLHTYYVEMLYPFYGLCWAYIVVLIFKIFQSGEVYLVRRRFLLARVMLWVVFANLMFAGGFTEGFRVVLDYQSFDAWKRNPRAFYADYFPQHRLEKLADQLQVIDYLKAHSSHEDKVYVWGTAPLINFLSERESPTRFVSNLGLISPWGAPHWRDELVSGLEAEPPLFLVVAKRDAIPTVSDSYLDSEKMLANFPGLGGLIGASYEPALKLSNFTVYRRK